MNRIAPTMGLPVHDEAVTWLNDLIVQGTLRKDGEPHSLTLELIGQWRRWRVGVSSCRHVVGEWQYIGHQPMKMAVPVAAHLHAVQVIDRVMLDLEAEFGWPAPPKPIVTEFNINELRLCVREIEACREDPRKY